MSGKWYVKFNIEICYNITDQHFSRGPFHNVQVENDISISGLHTHLREKKAIAGVPYVQIVIIKPYIICTSITLHHK